MQHLRTVSRECAHCGRSFVIGGALWRNGKEYPLCHPPIGGSADCYHLVTTHQENLGERLPMSEPPRRNGE